VIRLGRNANHRCFGLLLRPQHTKPISGTTQKATMLAETT